MVEPAGHLDNAPIKEALIDFQVTLPENTEVMSLDNRYSDFSKAYPKKEKINEGVFSFSIADNESTSQQQHIGFRYTSSDAKYVAQFRLGRFTLSRLEPYTTWEEMKTEAQKLWGAYVKSVAPSTVTRVATRFINIMPLRLREIPDLEKWLESAPTIPKDLPQGMSSFLSRIMINNQDIEANGIITLAFEPTDEEKPPVTFDIDVFANKTYRTDAAELWDCLEKLRDFKNQIFFRSITDLTLKEFQ